MAAPDMIRLIVGAAFLAYAAASDWRTREVKDELWVVLGAIALALLGYQMWSEALDWRVALLFVPTAVLLYDPLLGESFRKEEGGWVFRPRTAAVDVIAFLAAAYAVGAVLADGDPAASAVLGRYIAVPTMMLVFRGMYEFRLLRGGADAKAMIVLAALVPTYPDLPPLPFIALDPRLQGVLSTWFPFSFVVLADGVLVSLVIEIGLLLRNTRRGHLKFPHALIGYKVPLDGVPKHAWFMDLIQDGKHVVVYYPREKQDRDAIVRDLKAAGFTEAWVTPAIPLAVFIFVGYILAFVAGNLLVGFLQVMIPRP